MKFTRIYTQNSDLNRVQDALSSTLEKDIFANAYIVQLDLKASVSQTLSVANGANVLILNPDSTKPVTIDYSGLPLLKITATYDGTYKILIFYNKF
jgi:hypothetical protein